VTDRHFFSTALLVAAVLAATGFAPRLSAQPYVPGTTYFGRSNYIEYIAGDLPFIVSAPHGGTLKPAEIPDRTYGTFATDTNTEDLARKVRTEFQNLTGHTPHVIICRLDRDKIDCNREIVEGAQGDPEAEIAWNEFQNFIIAARADVVARHGAGFYIDLHGHGHDIQRLELGYLLSSSELALADTTLNSTFYENQTSIRRLSQDSPLTFPALLRGAQSFGAMMVEEGYPSVPSPSDPSPGTNAYFNGGYNTVEHTSVNGGTVSGLQIESNYTGVRDTSANRTAFGQALARVMDRYFMQHYGLNLRTCSASVWNSGTGSWGTAGNWLPPVLPVSSNVLAFAGPGGTVTHNLSALTAGNGVITSIIFSNGAAASYTLAGNAVRLLAGVTNDSSGDHTINLPLTLAQVQSFNAGAGSLTFGGAVSNGGNQLVCVGEIALSGVVSGGGGVTKTGPGTLALTAVNTYSGPTTNQSGTISLNATATFGDGTGQLVLAGGDVLSRNTRSSAPIANPIRLTASSTIAGNGVLTNSLRVLPFSSGDIVTTGGTLTIRNTGTNAGATNNVFRVRLSGGGFNFTRSVTVGFVDDLPSTLSQLESYNDLAAGDQTFSGAINGTGQFRRDAADAATAGRTVFSGINSYSGGTIVNAGTLLVNNPFGSGTGTGLVAVSNNGTLGGSGSIMGAVWCAGTISAGQSVGTLTLDGGLDLASGGTNVWELSSLTTAGAGTDYDQIILTGGTLTLGGGARLRLVFTGGAAAPDAGQPFWQGIRSWKIITLTGGATNPAATAFPQIVNGSYAAGSFTNYTDAAGSVWLRFVPVNAFARPVIDPVVAHAGTNQTAIHWAAVEGQTYRIEYKDDLAAPSWTVLDTVVADSVNESFTDATAPPAKRFYRIVIP
jgi:autotransporter-associated beta strand protein